MREDKKKKKKTEERTQGAMLLHSSSSSSIRRESPPDTYRSTAAIGCMAGIFRLFSNHHSNRRLTYAGKKEEQSGSVEVVVVNPPRCATMPDEITSHRSSSSVAAEAEKRMFLLGALAKCDEHLRELKKIIEELKSDSLSEPRKVKDDELVAELSSGEQPSPVSVLDEVTRSPPFSRRGRGRSLQFGNVRQQQHLKKIHKEEFLGSIHLTSIQQAAQHDSDVSATSLWCSRAMVETVEKACSEIAWGEKRERERIGMALQDQIYRDLIHEMVKEVMEIASMHCAQHLRLSYINGKFHRLGCRRRLSY